MANKGNKQLANKGKKTKDVVYSTYSCSGRNCSGRFEGNYITLQDFTDHKTRCNKTVGQKIKNIKGEKKGK